MKKMFLSTTLTFMLCFYASLVFAGKFVKVVSDHNDLTYYEGERASFVIFMEGLATNPDYEFILKGSFPDGKTFVDLNKIGWIYYFKTPKLVVGNPQFTIKVLLIEKKTSLFRIDSNIEDVVVEKESFSLTVSLRTVDGDLVPPDPGSAGNETLEGIDSDEDGVRDDVELWINNNVFDGPEVRMALKQGAKYLGLGLQNANDKIQSIYNSNKFLEACACLEWASGDQRSRELIKIIQANFYNTEVRVRTFLKTLVNYHGQSLPPSLVNATRSSYSSFCEFTPEKELK